MNHPQGGRGPAQPLGRQALIPANPLPVSVALVQVFILLGIPIALLVIARFILRRYFPELGY